MTVQRIDHLNLTVTDLDASTDFYHRIFGFERVEGGLRNGHRWAILRSGEALLCMYEYPDRHLASEDESGTHKLHTLNHIGLAIDDRDAWESMVQAESLDFSYPSPVEWPRSTAWYVLDPSGYEIEVALWHDGVQF